MSIKYKIALLFSLLSVIMFAFAGVTIYSVTAKERQDGFNTRLKNRAWSLANVAAILPENNYEVVRRLDSFSIGSLQNKSIAILNKELKPVYQFADSAGKETIPPPEIITEAQINAEYYYRDGIRDAIAIHYVKDDDNFVVAVAALDIERKLHLKHLAELLIWTLLASIIISFLTGLFFAGYIIKPLRRIVSEANLITSNNLNQRIYQGATKDELYKLGDTINGLLDRLHESFLNQRNFISNASHELSTPLTSVSSQLEVTLQKSRSQDEYREVITSVYDDVKDLHQLTRSLLDIARTGAAGGLELSDVRIDEVLLKVAAEVQKLKPAYKVSFDFEEFPENENMLFVFGNADLLYIALKNIIENGCKYADDNHVEVTVSFGEKAAKISVISKGDIISDKDIERIFQPFFRVEAARSKEGYGLGLPLTKRILSLHRGSVAVKGDTSGVTTFLISLPVKAN